MCGELEMVSFQHKSWHCPQSQGPNVIRKNLYAQEKTPLKNRCSRSLFFLLHLSWVFIGTTMYHVAGLLLAQKEGKQQGDINRRKCWTIWESEISIAGIFVGTTYILPNISGWHFGGLLVTGREGSEEECHFSQAQRVTVCRGSCLFNIHHKNESQLC